MAINKDKLDAARERLKEHPGGENLKMITNIDQAREMQKKGVAARKRNKEQRELLAALAKDVKASGEEISEVAPKGVDMLRFYMMEAHARGDYDMAATYAEKIAQYETPKLASQHITQEMIDSRDLTDEELEAELAKLEEDNE